MRGAEECVGLGDVYDRFRAEGVIRDVHESCRIGDLSKRQLLAVPIDAALSWHVPCGR